MLWTYVLMALAAGVVLPVQAGINSRLGGVAGGAEPAALVSFLVGTLALGVWIAARRISLPFGEALAAGSWWYWIGGVMGAYFVASTVVLVPKLGAGLMTALILAGQVSAALLLDHYGVLGYAQRQMDWKRALGAILVVAGVLLIRK